MPISNVNSLNSVNVKFYPNFKSTNVTIPAQKSDTVEISSKKKKKEGMSTGYKWLLGLAGTATVVYAGLVGHRAFSRPTLETLQKDFTEIFRRNVSKEEVPEILKKYNEILKINDEKEFCEKVFEQVKKDYGYEKLDIKPTLNESTDSIFGGQWLISGEAFLVFYKNIIEHFGGKFNKVTKAKILDSIFHEFQHVKQTEYCMRTNPEEYFKVIIRDDVINQRFIEQCENALKNPEILNQSAKIYGIDTEQYRQILIRDLEYLKEHGYKSMPPLVEKVNNQMVVVKEHLGQLFGGYEKFKPGSKEYELGEKYINNFKNYVEAKNSGDNKEYLEQLVEKEAFNAEDKSLGVLKRLKSIWNVFDNTNYDKLKIREN